MSKDELNGPLSRLIILNVLDDIGGTSPFGCD